MSRDEPKIRISFDVEGDLAKAFIKEMNKTLATKAKLGRVALVEYLNTKGYNVEDTTAPWGGTRDASEDDEQGQELAYATSAA